jgi:hypothetical protein
MRRQELIAQIQSKLAEAKRVEAQCQEVLLEYHDSVMVLGETFPELFEVKN